MIINNESVNDPFHTAQHLNRYLADIGPRLSDQICNRLEDHMSYLGTRQIDEFILAPTYEQEVLTMIKELKDCSPGDDDVPMHVMKQVAPSISPILVHLFNSSFRFGIFPDDFKLAKVVPIIKSGDRKLASNYRPISVLSAFSKILEKLTYNRLTEFLDTLNIITDSQYGFRRKHSTETTLLKLTTKILESMDENMYTLGISLDLSKVFDSLDHSILLDKLEHYGMRGVTLDWFRSCITNRKQLVQYQNCKSSSTSVQCGVPQGSILGPLLFLLYINNITRSSNILNYILFANDSNLYVSSIKVYDLLSIGNREVIKVSDWMMSNKLTLNLEKTHYFVFARRNKSSSHTPSHSRQPNVTNR